MVRVTVLYPNESAKRFDHEYYARKHMPIAAQGFGMLRYEVDKGLAAGGPGAPAPFIAVLYESRMPALLLEAGMIVNRAEEQVLSSPKPQSDCCRSGRWGGGAILRRASATNLMTSLIADPD